MREPTASEEWLRSRLEDPEYRAAYDTARWGRPDWDEYFLALAQVVAVRADCRRAQIGAVITKANRVRSTGYNGGPPGGPSCLAGDCPRGLKTYEELKGFEGGVHDYSDCIALHAEVNAITYADRDAREGATLYLWPKPPCDMCWKLVRASGVTRVVWPDGQEEW